MHTKNYKEFIFCGYQNKFIAIIYKNLSETVFFLFFYFASYLLSKIQIWIKYCQKKEPKTFRTKNSFSIRQLLNHYFEI